MALSSQSALLPKKIWVVVTESVLVLIKKKIKKHWLMASAKTIEMIFFHVGNVQSSVLVNH